MTHSLLKSFLLGFVVLLFGSCAASSQNLNQAASLTKPAQSAALNQITDLSYRLGSGDKVNILVFGEAELSGEFNVSSTGQISFPLIGNLDVLNRTINELQNDLVAKLQNGYLREPKVSVSVINYRPFYILGEVNTPGEYAYISDLNVLNAVAKAGGFTYRAKTTKIYIRRANETTEIEYKLDPDTKVYPGDTIRIAERFF